MRILILTQHYHPEPEMSHTLAKGLLERGHAVTVVTGFPSYPTGRIYPEYGQRLWQREEVEGVRIVRVPLYPDHSRSAILRSANIATFALSAALLSPFLGGRADVMLVQDPPIGCGSVAMLLKRLRALPFVYRIEDLWPDALKASGMVTNRLALATAFWLAHLVYRDADAIVVLSQGTKDALIAMGFRDSKIHVIPNWPYEGIGEPAEPDARLAQELGMSGRFNVVYTGNLGPCQGIDSVLAAADLLAELPKIQFVLIGDGSERAALARRVRDGPIPNVRMFGPQPLSQMPALYALADALLIHLSDDPALAIAIPSKTQSYLASGRPIIAAVAGDAARMILRSGAGIVASPANPGDLAGAVRRLYSLSPAERRAMGDHGRAYCLRELAPDVLIDRYEKILAKVGQAGRWR